HAERERRDLSPDPLTILAQRELVDLRDRGRRAARGDAIERGERRDADLGLRVADELDEPVDGLLVAPREAAEDERGLLHDERLAVAELAEPARDVDVARLGGVDDRLE